MSTLGFDEVCALAREAVSLGKFQEARDLYAQAVAASPDSPDAHYGLATCCYYLTDLDTALQHFLQVTRLDPRRARAFVNLGALYNRLGQQDEAIKHLRKGLQLDPRLAEAYYNLGIAYRQKGMSELAIQAYREATRLNPRMADAFLNLGNALLEAERYREATAAYQQAITERPNFDRALRGLRKAELALAAATQPPRTPLSPAPAHTGTTSVIDAEPAQGFANVVERAEAIEALRDACGKQEELCREIVRVIEQDLGPALHDLSRSLVGTPAAGELDLQVRAYETSLQNLRAARQNLDKGTEQIQQIGSRFAASAQAADGVAG